jgi:hypothetical protein
MLLVPKKNDLQMVEMAKIYFGSFDQNKNKNILEVSSSSGSAVDRLMKIKNNKKI